MQKRLVQATATALLFATFAVPAFAQGNDKNKGHDRDREEKHESSDSERGGRGLHLGWLKHFEIRPPAAESTCLAQAKLAKKHSMILAEDTLDDALDTARNSYLSAIGAATQTKMSARLSARTAFLASDGSLASWSAYLSARKSANDTWELSTRIARASFASAKNAAQSVLNAARAKALVDLQAAEAACATATPPPAASDTVAPSAVTNLSLSGATASSVILNWTAPGDDAAIGTAASYDVRYSTSAVTAANFASATAAIGEPVPAATGTSQSMTVSGLTPSTTYFFAIKAIDDASNAAAISNVTSVQTTP